MLDSWVLISDDRELSYDLDMKYLPHAHVFEPLAHSQGCCFWRLQNLLDLRASWRM